MPVAVLLFLLLCVSIRADDISLVNVRDNWKYFKGTNEPSPSKLWTQVGFDDSTWLQSLASVGSPEGYGETTQLLDYGTTYTTIYFRRTFEVIDPDRFAQLALRIDYDDGFIAYLNGREITRRGIQSPINEPIPFNTYAAYHPRGITEEIDVSNGIPELRAGSNTLAIQLLGWRANDFTACMVAELKANFTRAPYIQNTSSNSTLIAWKTLSPALAFVEYGLTTNNPVRFSLSGRNTNHVATLTGLLSDTEYFYKVGANLNDKDVTSDWRIFRTFKIAGPLSFEVVGDTGWATPAQLAIARQMEIFDRDLIFHVGDLAYFTFTQSNADFRFFSMYEDQFRTTPFMVAVGNHDHIANLTNVLENMYLPTNSATGTEHYFSFDHGDAHFVAL